MYNGKRILAIVPARSGSKGIKDKNIKPLNEISLIGHAGLILSECTWLDAKILSTDSPLYAEEAGRYQLAVPSLRPAELSSDTARVMDAIKHDLAVCEAHYGQTFDIILIIEPTSPNRTAEDLTACVATLTASDADSVVTVSPIDTKYHPDKLLTIKSDKLTHYSSEGKNIRNRQELKNSYFIRNGICYALTRNCVLEHGRTFTTNTLPVIIDRPVANIDSEIDLIWANFISQHTSQKEAPHG